MRSAGNDIIALCSINKERSNNNRFYTQILSGTEELLYSDHLLADISFEHFLWLAWSVKESVYKFIKRRDPALVFAPTKISIEQLHAPSDPVAAHLDGDAWEGFASKNTCYSGSVVFEDQQYYFRTRIDDEVIASIVNADEDFENTHWGIRKIEPGDRDFQSREVRSFLLTRLNHLFPGSPMRIKSSEIGYPVIMQGEEELDIPVSFSHHYSFVSYSFLLEQPAF